MSVGKPSVDVTEAVIPSFLIKEQYLAEYFELVSRFQACNGLRLKGYSVDAVVKSKHYRLWLTSIISLGEKLRRKMENKNRGNDLKPYETFLNNLDELYTGVLLSYENAVNCTRDISNYLEDGGYTKLDIPKISPGRAVDEWD